MARWTNFPNGITSLGIPTFGTGFVPPFPSNYFFVQENSNLGAGVSGGEGTAQHPFNTLDDALAACTAGNNDVVFFAGTQHRTSALAWNKNNTHLVGLCAPLKRGKRARISVSGSTPFSYLVNNSANGCIFQNFGTFYGFPTTGATTPVCWNDTGGRNCYNLVEFLGFGDNTVTTGTANQTTARAFVLNTSTGETTWRSCVFGGDTLQRNATNYTLEIAGGAPRCTIEDCDFESVLGSSGTGSSHLLIGSSGIYGYLDVITSRFLCDTQSSGSTMTQALHVSSSANGFVLLDRSTGFGFTHWETSASGCVVLDMPAPTAHDGGIAVAASPS